MTASAVLLSNSNIPAKRGIQFKRRDSAFLLSPPSTSLKTRRSGGMTVEAFFNPLEDPIAKEALKEPVAFMGGLFAGLLRLDLNEEPLRDWIARTAEASGASVEELATDRDNDEDSPQEIEIE